MTVPLWNQCPYPHFWVEIEHDHMLNQMLTCAVGFNLATRVIFHISIEYLRVIQAPPHQVIGFPVQAVHRFVCPILQSPTMVLLTGIWLLQCWCQFPSVPHSYNDLLKTLQCLTCLDGFYFVLFCSCLFLIFICLFVARFFDRNFQSFVQKFPKFLIRTHFRTEFLDFKYQHNISSCLSVLLQSCRSQNVSFIYTICKMSKLAYIGSVRITLIEKNLKKHSLLR